MICILDSALLTRITIIICHISVLCYSSFYYDISPFVASHLSVLSQGLLQLQVRCDSTKPGEDLAVAGDAPLPGWRGLHLGNFSRSQRKKTPKHDERWQVACWFVDPRSGGKPRSMICQEPQFFCQAGCTAAHERSMFQALRLWWNGFVEWVPVKAKIQCLVKPIGQCRGYKGWQSHCEVAKAWIYVVLLVQINELELSQRSIWHPSILEDWKLAQPLEVEVGQE